MTSSSRRVVRCAVLVVGVALGALIVAGRRVSGRPTAPGAHVHDVADDTTTSGSPPPNPSPPPASEPTGVTSWSRRAARSAGLVLGVALVAVMLVGWRVPGGSKAPGAQVSVTINRTGELDVEPLGRLMDARDLRPGRFAQARFTVVNTTGTAVDVRLRARVDGTDLDDELAFGVTARGISRFSGTLGQLRVPTRRRLIMSPGAHVPLIVRVWVPSRARDYRGRSAEVTLELKSKAAG
jgi:hypothetical protein